MQEHDAEDEQSVPHIGLIRLLQLGTLAGCLLIFCGLLVPFFWRTGSVPYGARYLIQGGIALFILLPSARVALLFCLYFQANDIRMAAISAAVLIILGASLCFAF
jgi:hypothetical protein